MHNSYMLWTSFWETSYSDFWSALLSLLILFFLSFRYPYTCFPSFSYPIIASQSWANKLDLCSKDLNTSQCLRNIWEYLQKFYSKSVYTYFDIQKLCVCLGEGRREWKEEMKGNEVRKAGNDSLQMKSTKHQEFRFGWSKSFPLLSPTLFWPIISHPIASAAQKNNGISSVPVRVMTW